MKHFLSAALLGFLSLPTLAQSPTEISQRTVDALTHVVAHEIGHAFLREFDIPILGPEESIADDFATVYVQMLFPVRAEAIISARADQNFSDGQQSGPFSEYVDDDQRAGRSICVLYGLDPDRYEGLLKRYNMNDDEATICRDFAPEVARSWRRLIADYRMPDNARVTEVRLIGDNIPLAHIIAESELRVVAETLMASIDWHSQITLSFEACDGSAGWSRNERKITICDTYVELFERQLGVDASDIIHRE